MNELQPPKQREANQCTGFEIPLHLQRHNGNGTDPRQLYINKFLKQNVSFPNTPHDKESFNFGLGFFNEVICTAILQEALQNLFWNPDDSHYYERINRVNNVLNELKKLPN